MDLSSLSQALQEATASDHSGDQASESLVQLIQDGLQSADPARQHAVLDTVSGLLSGDSSDASLLAKQNLLFGEHVLTFLPLILPLHALAPGPSKRLVEICLSVCSPREAILALNEACQGLEERLFGMIVSDDESDDGEQEPIDDGAEQEDIPNQLVIVLQGYRTIFARLPATKSTPTLLAVSDALSSALTNLSNACDGEVAQRVIIDGSAMVEAAWDWVKRSTDAGGEQRAMLSQLFYIIVLMHGPRAEQSLGKRWFTSRFPRYATLHPLESAQSRPLEAAQRTAVALSLDLDKLADNIASTTSSGLVSPHAGYASLILIADHLAHADGEAGQKLGLPQLDECLLIISAALSSTAVDAGLVLTWELAQRAKAGSISFIAAEQLIELVIPLCATHPDPLIRLATWKLVGELVQKAPDGLDRLKLLNNLIEPANPFLPARVQALSLFRQVVSQSASCSRSATSESQPILHPSLLDTVCLLPHPEDSQHGPQELLESPYAELLTEQLVALHFLRKTDEHNITGIRSPEWVARIERNALGPARDVLRRLQAYSAAQGEGSGTGQDPHGAQALQVEFALRRLEDAVKALEI